MGLVFRPASRWARLEYLNLSAGFAGDDRGRGKHCVFFMAVKDVRNGHSSRIHSNILRSVTFLLQPLSPTTMFLNKISIQSHAELFLVDSAVIEHRIRSLGMFLWVGVCIIAMFLFELWLSFRLYNFSGFSDSTGYARGTNGVRTEYRRDTDGVRTGYGRSTDRVRTANCRTKT